MTLPIGEWIVFQPVVHHDGVGLHFQGIQLKLVETKNSCSIGCNFLQFLVQICNQSLLRCFLFQIRMKLSVFFSTRSRRVTLMENKKVQVFRERKLHKVSLLCVGHLAVGYRYDQR